MPAQSQSSTKSKLKLEPELDRLNLSGLLNVLDGVVDTPGRVVETQLIGRLRT